MIPILLYKCIYRRAKEEKEDDNEKVKVDTDGDDSDGAVRVEHIRSEGVLTSGNFTDRTEGYISFREISTDDTSFILDTSDPATYNEVNNLVDSRIFDDSGTYIIKAFIKSVYNLMIKR